MFTASFDSKMTGKITPVVPNAISLLGQEKYLVGTEYHYEDMEVYNQVLNALRARNMLKSACPYTEFLSAPTSEGEAFDWDAVPKSTMETIMPHQRECVDVVVGRLQGRAIVALEPGLGKTMIGCLAATHYGDKVLIICPASKVIDWGVEFQEWTGRTLRDVVIVTFQTATDHPERIASHWDCVVIDECHKLKNENIRTRTLLPILRDNCTALVMLSGTPQENRPCELFNLLSVIHADVFDNRETFSMRYAEGGIGSRGVWEERGSSFTEELALIVAKCMYRRNDVKVVSTPIKRTMIWVNPTAEQSPILAQQEAKRRKLVIAEQRAPTPAIKLKIGVMRNHHANLMWRTSGKFKAVASLERIKRLAQVDHPTEKMVVFCNHLANARVVMEALSPLGKTVMVSGSTKLPKRQALLQALRDPKGETRFGVLTIGAIGEGINLCPGVTVTVFLETDRVPAKMTQAEKRTHRKGTVLPISSYWMMLEHSSDSANLDKLQDKATVNEAVVGGNAKFVFDHVEEAPAMPEDAAAPPKPAPKKRKRVKQEEREPKKIIIDLST